MLTHLSARALERVVQFSEEQSSALANAIREATTVIEATLEEDG